MGQLDWLPRVLRNAGCDVYVMPGAETRTTRSSGMPARPPAVIWHHTATSTAWADGHVAALLRDGRRDLSGPLSQLGVERDGTIVVVACGRANHNGARSAQYGNDAIGVEFYNAGDGADPWPTVQLEAGQRAIAAILRHLELGADRCVGHKESDPTRKIDPRPLDMSDMRAGIARYLEGDNDDMSAADIARLERKLDGIRERIERQIDLDYPFGTERINRNGKLVADGVEAAPAERWLIETTLGVRELLARDAVDLDLDVDAVAERIADLLDDDLADAVADELDRRARARLDEVTDA